MRTETKFRVMWVNDYGQGEMNQDGFHTIKDAQEYCDELKQDFKDQDYYVEEYSKVVQRGYRNTSNVVDGWEDLYNY